MLNSTQGKYFCMDIKNQLCSCVLNSGMLKQQEKNDNKNQDVISLRTHSDVPYMTIGSKCGLAGTQLRAGAAWVIYGSTGDTLRSAGHAALATSQRWPEPAGRPDRVGLDELTLLRHRDYGPDDHRGIFHPAEFRRKALHPQMYICMPPL